MGQGASESPARPAARPAMTTSAPFSGAPAQSSLPNNQWRGPTGPSPLNSSKSTLVPVTRGQPLGQSSLPELDPGFSRQPLAGGERPLPKAAKAEVIKDILSQLESQLANPTDAIAVGNAYRRLGDWTWDHKYDDDLDEVLNLLAPESMYPDWRRQALYEAYMLFYEDVAKQGNPDFLGSLPEPPTSEDIGLPLPEAMLGRNPGHTVSVSHHYENGSPFCLTRRWDYEIKKTGPQRSTPRVAARASGDRRSGGRQIVMKGQTARYCACATDPMTRIGSTLSSGDFCCARNGKSLWSMLSSSDRQPASSEPYKPLAPTADWPQRPTRSSDGLPGSSPSPMVSPSPAPPIWRGTPISFPAPPGGDDAALVRSPRAALAVAGDLQISARSGPSERSV